MTLTHPPSVGSSPEDSLELLRWLDQHADGWGFQQGASGEGYHCFVAGHYARGPHLEAEAPDVEHVPQSLAALALQLYEVLAQVPEGTLRNAIPVECWPEYARPKEV
jgi:hypothetical protein